MLIQHRMDAIHLISQNDHALVSGEMARIWRGVTPSSEPPSIEAVLAISLHDAAWIGVDAELPIDQKTGLPYDFQSLPSVRKLEVYTAGIDALEAVHPYAALLVSMHYGAFVAQNDHPGFHSNERQRRQRLGAEFANRFEEAAVSRDFALLRLLDVLSLRLCLTAPGTLEERLPRWLMSPMQWDGAELRMAWKEEDECVIAPFPFHHPFEVAIPFERRARGSVSSTATGSDVAHGTWRVRIASA
jgi:Protein of unknown function (DUF3891)